MGSCGPHNRREYVARQKKGWKSEERTVTVRKHHAHKNEDWFILDVANADGTNEAVITMLLWEGGYVKNMDETAGPYYYGCPVAWLDEVPCPDSTAAYDWRMKVRGTPVNRCENCHKLDCQGHDNELIVVSASGDWATNVPQGMVGVCACFGGFKNGRYASALLYRLVPKEVYDKRGDKAFVVDHHTAPVWDYDEANPYKPSERKAVA